MPTGTVKFFNTDKGFFTSATKTAATVHFVHITAVHAFTGMQTAR
jgi:cold shock CspA family protein